MEPLIPQTPPARSDDEPHAIERMDPVALGRRLRACRVVAGLSWVAVMETMKEQGTWHPGMRLLALESGEWRPMTRGLSRFFLALSRLYGCSLTDFFFDRPESEDVWRQLAAHEITHGLAAYWLGIDQLELRLQAEKRGVSLW